MAEKTSISLKEKLLDAARKQLTEKGYRNLSLRKIASDAGVSATSIYLHFENKDHLIHSMMEEAIDRLNADLAGSISDMEDPVKKLETLAKVYVKFALSNPREYQIIHMVSSNEMARYPKEKFRKARQGYEIVTKVIEEGVKGKYIDEKQPRLAAYIVWAQLHGMMSVVLSRRLDTRINQQEFIKEAIKHIIYGFHVRTAVDAK